MNNILLIGGPGSGKGTLGKFLARIDGVHLSTGEMFRYHMKNKTPIGVEVQEAISAGGLAKDQTTFDMMVDEISKYHQLVELEKNNKSTSGKTLVFDGFPRNLPQGPLLDELLEKFGRKLDVVFFLDVPDEILIERLRNRALVENRPEDSDPIYCAKRIEVFHKQTTPLIDFYKSRGILVTIDGTNTIDEVREFATNILISNIYDNFPNSSYGPEQVNR